MVVYQALYGEGELWVRPYDMFFCNSLKINCYICKRACIPYAETVKKENRIMAKPIKETPILYDEDAYRFEMAAHHVVPLPEEEREKIRQNYEEVKKHCTFL